MHLKTIIKCLSGGAKLLRILKGHGLVQAIRERAMHSTLASLHQDIFHRMRLLATQMSNQWDKEEAIAARLAFEISTHCRSVIGNLLELSPHRLHCCIKMMVDDNRVATWVRSDPIDGRPVEKGDTNAHEVSKNSVWAALLGRSDGRATWQPFNCFCCNDLFAHPVDFICDRRNWQNYYRSALVFPVRYAKNTEGTELVNLGFIAFDSPTQGVFRGLPDIFNYQSNIAEYQERLQQSAIFHLGAILADSLGTFLGTAYARRSQSSLPQGAGQ